MWTHSLNLYRVLSETKRIVNAHSRYFLGLAVLFLLSLSFSFIVYSFLSHSSSTLSRNHPSLSFYSLPEFEIPPIDISNLIFPILYGFFVFLFSIFYGRPFCYFNSVFWLVFFFFFLLLISLFLFGLYIGFLYFVCAGNGTKKRNYKMKRNSRSEKEFRKWNSQMFTRLNCCVRAKTNTIQAHIIVKQQKGSTKSNKRSNETNHIYRFQTY